MFDADDKYFRVLMLRSDWTRFQTQMVWNLWNRYKVPKMAAMTWPRCFASACSVAKTYPSIASSEAISVRQQQVDAEVGGMNVIISG